MNKPYLQHTHFICRDLQGMIDFWVDVLGAEFVEMRQFGPADGAVLNMNSITQIFLKKVDCEPQTASSPRAGIEHPGVVVADLDVTLAHIKSLPYGRVTREPFMATGRRCAFITGPEGILVEVMEDLK